MLSIALAKCRRVAAPIALAATCAGLAYGVAEESDATAAGALARIAGAIVLAYFLLLPRARRQERP